MQEMLLQLQVVRCGGRITTRSLVGHEEPCYIWTREWRSAMSSSVRDYEYNGHNDGFLFYFINEYYTKLASFKSNFLPIWRPLELKPTRLQLLEHTNRIVFLRDSLEPSQLLLTITRDNILVRPSIV